MYSLIDISFIRTRSFRREFKKLPKINKFAEIDLPNLSGRWVVERESKGPTGFIELKVRISHRFYANPSGGEF